ncbi:MAG: TetR/AcrR family transcriptional regulator [Magnetovibrionaceae bacterium]
MARSKEFNVDEALDKAMQAFWYRGFEGTSVQDLVDCMGIQRGSLYGTFGDKEQLFLQAFEHYDERRRTLMAEQRPPLEAIRNWFDRVIEGATADDLNKGCFIVNTAMELESHSDPVRKRLKQSLDEIEAFFLRNVKQAQAEGLVKRGVDPEKSAQILLGALVAIRALSRSRPEAGMLRTLAEHALSPLTESEPKAQL